jgi:hypothetical protein
MYSRRLQPVHTRPGFNVNEKQRKNMASCVVPQPVAPGRAADEAT